MSNRVPDNHIGDMQYQDGRYYVFLADGWRKLEGEWSMQITASDFVTLTDDTGIVLEYQGEPGLLAALSGGFSR